MQNRDYTHAPRMARQSKGTKVRGRTVLRAQYHPGEILVIHVPVPITVIEGDIDPWVSVDIM